MTGYTMRCAHVGCGQPFTRGAVDGPRPWQAASDAVWEHYMQVHVLGERPRVVQLDGVTWQEMFLEAVRAIPVGTEFTTADLHGRVPDPPDHHHWGAATTVAAHMGLIVVVTTQKSELETTKGSRLLRWRRVDVAAAA